MSIQPPPLLCQPWTGPWPPPHLFQAGLAGEQQSGAKQRHPILYSGCVETDENARFGIILYLIGKYSGHVLDTLGTFVLHSKYILGIPATFCLNSWTLEPYSAAIPRAFWLHSRHLPTGLQELLWQQSNCSRMAFEVDSEHHDSILNIPTVFQTTFELHSSANTLGMCRNHSMRVRSEFLVFERHS